MAEEMMNEPPMEGQVDMVAAQKTLMSPDPEIEGVLMSRITQMSPEDLQALDSAVTPEVSTALLKLLPELGELIAFLNDQDEKEPMPEDMETMDQSGMPKEMGALGNM